MDATSKRDTMRDALKRGFTVRVVVDTKASKLPAHLLEQPSVILDYAKITVPMIPDLEVADDGIHATLSFRGLPFKTFVPWAAVLKLGAMPKKEGPLPCRYCKTRNPPGIPCRHCGAPPA